MARKSSLGPFPKTHRWRELVGSAVDADLAIERIRAEVAALAGDDHALAVITFFVAMPIASRFDNPAKRLSAAFGIEWLGNPRSTLLELVSMDAPVGRAALATLDRLLSSARFDQTALVATDPWLPWRTFDSTAFCDLGRLFFACLVEQYLFAEVAGQAREVERHAWELSKITQSFSARWYSKCAARQIPELGSIRWYLGHCLGKVDMELERELSTHVEPLPNPFKRKKTEPPSLGLGI